MPDPTYVDLVPVLRGHLEEMYEALDARKNTVEKEGTLFVAADGKTAYYASDRADSKGNLDIYTFDLPEKVISTFYF